MRAGDWFGFGMILALLLIKLFGLAGWLVLLVAWGARTIMVDRERRRPA